MTTDLIFLPFIAVTVWALAAYFERRRAAAEIAAWRRANDSLNDANRDLRMQLGRVRSTGDD